MTNKEFRQLEPFDAILVKIERIKCSEQTVPSAMAISDYRVTLKKPNGSIIVIKRVTAILGNNDNWPGTISVTSTDPPLIVGKQYTFPNDLYKNHGNRK